MFYEKVIINKSGYQSCKCVPIWIWKENDIRIYNELYVFDTNACRDSNKN